jgi:excinuclease ABC subunit C
VAFTAFFEQYYNSTGAIPDEILTSDILAEPELLATWLGEKAGTGVRLTQPQRGDKHTLLGLALKNASLKLDEWLIAHGKAGQRAPDEIVALRDALGIRELPRRIECFDISTIQGSDTVASMVVCDEGRMRPSEYRKFRITGAGLRAPGSGKAARGFGLRAPAPTAVNDDFAAMHEVVQRRYRKVLEEGGPFPDLVLIDGGKGQLSAAYEALEALGLAGLVAVGIAKKDELLFTRDHDRPKALAHDDPALLLLQRIRDEAHRFAVTFHRRRRALRDLGSELDEVPGIGGRRRRALLRTFGSLAGVRRATREELSAEVGPKVADAVLAFFAGRP